MEGCCFCYTLRSGAILIGVLEILSAGFIILGVIRSSHKGDQFASTQEDEEWWKSNYNVLLYVTLTVCLLDIFFACLLLLGIRKDIPLLLKIWVIYQFLRMAENLCFTILDISMDSKKTKNAFILHLLGMGITLYFILSVYAFNIQMESDLKQKHELKIENL